MNRIVSSTAFKRLNLRRLSMWTDDSTDYTRLLSVFFRRSYEAAGGAVTSTDYFKQRQEDLSALVKNLKDFRPDAQAIFVAGNPVDAPRAIDVLRKSGFRRPILGGDGFDMDLASSVSKPEFANDFYFSTHAYRGDTRPEVLAFIDAYKEDYGKEPENAFAALGYDAVNLVANAFMRAGTTDSVKLAEALLATRDFKGVTGTISYVRPNRVPVKPVSIVGIRNGAYSVLWMWQEEK
ncbi:MAG: ABC transporter substrate-binding protein [Desulfomonile sp.]|nr:ABC transporter substrate-binding protein [Desulfomonile sp.]